MKIVIFGASGRTGLPLVQQALAAGHQVVAFVRDPSKLGSAHQNLTVVQGDVMSATAVANAVSTDTDAVISVLAPVKGSPPDLLPIAVEHIVSAMRQRGVKRLIYMTGAGIEAPEDKPQFINHVIKFALKTLAAGVLAQSRLAVENVQASGLDWTIVRGPVLNDNPHSGRYKVGWVGVNTGPRLSRADAADFILTQLADSTYMRKAPMLSN